MAHHCIKCQNDILDKEFLLCTLCENYYHVGCTNISNKLFYLMSKEGKKCYRCPACLSKQKHLHHNKSPEQSKSEHGLDVNVTHRIKQKVNIPTENSFEALKLTDDDEEDDEYSSFTTTQANTLNRSYTEIRINDSYIIEEMKDTIRSLKERLEITENELDNQILENHSLAKKITEYDLQIKKLSHICRSTTKKKNNRKTQKENIVGVELHFPNEDLGHSQNLEIETTMHTRKTVQSIADAKHSGSHQEITTETANTTHNRSYIPKYSQAVLKHLRLYKRQFQDDYANRKKLGLKKRKLLIVSDQQGKNLGPLLYDVYGEYFDIICYTKPGADTKNVLKPLLALSSDINKDDFVIILSGTNDKNPNDIFTYMHYTLQQLENVKVLISQIPYNRYLNEIPLNKMLKLISTQYVYCDVVQCNYENWIYKTKVMFLKNVAENMIHKMACKLHNPSYIYQLLRQNLKKEETLETRQREQVVEELKYDHDMGTKPLSTPKARTFFRRLSI